MHQQSSLIAAVLVLSLLNGSSAQESKLYAPQPEHELLKRFAGEWQFEKMTAPGGGSSETGFWGNQGRVVGRLFCRL
jgi:hypothetical protein